MSQSVADFAIFQNSRTKVTGVWVKGKGEWVEAEEGEFEAFAIIAQLIRTSPNPVEIVDKLKTSTIESNRSNRDKPNINWDTEPGFFIPPEELDGLDAL